MCQLNHFFRFYIGTLILHKSLIFPTNHPDLNINKLQQKNGEKSFILAD